VNPARDRPVEIHRTVVFEANGAQPRIASAPAKPQNVAGCPVCVRFVARAAAPWSRVPQHGHSSGAGVELASRRARPDPGTRAQRARRHHPRTVRAHRERLCRRAMPQSCVTCTKIGRIWITPFSRRG